MSLRHGHVTGSGYTYGSFCEPSLERLALLRGLAVSLQALDHKPMRDDGQAVEGAAGQAVLQQLVVIFRRRTLPLMCRLGLLA